MIRGNIFFSAVSLVGFIRLTTASVVELLGTTTRNIDCGRVELLSIPTREEGDLLFFRGMSRDRWHAFFVRVGVQDGKAHAFLDEVPIFQHEVAVVGEVISLRLGERVFANAQVSGAYHATTNQICRFLAGHINEEELLDSATKLDEEQNELERLRMVAKRHRELKDDLDRLLEFTRWQGIEKDELSAEVGRLHALVKDKDGVIDSQAQTITRWEATRTCLYNEVKRIPWWRAVWSALRGHGSRISRIRDILSVKPYTGE